VVDAAAPTLLTLSAVRKQWGERTILDGVDLTVEPGTIVSVTGSNGTGKTTLLRIAAGLIRPQSGHVGLAGLDAERDRSRYLARLGFLSSGDRGLYARLSARRHLDFAARLALISKSDRRRAVERALATFDLEGNADRRVDRLSTGQRQRVRLAMTFVHEPDLILLDEPANSLDADGLQLLTRYLEHGRAVGSAVVWCAPDGEEARLAADSAFRLAEGRLWPV
jgi:ABC-2 type transport system ATP-binding protein